MRKIGKVFSGVLLACVLALPFAASAATVGTYSFDISHSVDGTAVHKLANKSTSTTATANTYYYSGSVSSTKADYTVALYKNWLTSYDARLTANGWSATKSFGTVSAADYTVQVTKTTKPGDKVIGSGTIDQ